MRGDQTLADLHHAIFDAYGREEEHVYEFQFGKGPIDPKGPRYVLPGAYELSRQEGPPAAGRVTDTTLDALGLEIGDRFGYWFDFGDDWWHQINHDLGLAFHEADLFSQVPVASLREEFVATVMDGATVALAINTEKAKSEFIIAPLLLELRRSWGGAVGLFSGVELNVDPARGLNGVCDFILTRATRQFILTAPLVTIIEAKNDNLRSGLGQCIATMYAAELYNQQAGTPVAAVFGVVTTGSAWKFLRLERTTVTLDLKEYYIDNLGKILGVLQYMVHNA